MCRQLSARPPSSTAAARSWSVWWPRRC